MRSDFLVSVCVVDENNPHLVGVHLSEIIKKISEKFEYYEVLYVVNERYRDLISKMDDQFSQLKNLRIVLIADHIQYYHRRLIAAREAIGDVVTIFDCEELSVEELCGKLCESKDKDEILAGWCAKKMSGRWIYRLLSLTSHYSVAAEAARTIIIPREWLNALLVRRSAVLDLRFQACLPPTHYRYFDVLKKGNKDHGISRKYEILKEIILCDMPRYLKGYALVGSFVVLGAIFYLAYAVVVFMTYRQVQPGWFSNTVIQAGSIAFVAGGMSILSYALVLILDILQGSSNQDIVAEIYEASFFNNENRRNIEIN